MRVIQAGLPLTIEQIRSVALGEVKISLSPQAEANIAASYQYLQNKLQSNDRLYYGINTGFGSLCNIAIPEEDLSQLQHNLVRSHACGCGELVPDHLVRLMLFLKVQSLSYGHSAVNPATVQLLLELYNLNILPVVYNQGSLGASGDLAPLAHLCLPLIGDGKVKAHGQIMEASEALQKAGLQPVKLGAKEGLALLNGTQFMLAYASWCVLETERLAHWADFLAAAALDAFDGKSEPFRPELHRIRPHKGQIHTANQILNWLKGSEIQASEKVHVQDPYSFRCVPQVHGASKQVVEHVRQVVETELNSVTDNPNVFPEEDAILSGGNFHGQPLALAMDYLAIGLHELGHISERRVYKLISGERGLPPFLVANPGLNSGLMIPQYTAASIVSQNKQLCTPASVDSIPSSNGQEDHVSMGANAATKLYRVLDNTYSLFSIEMLNISQALHFRKPLQSSPSINQVMERWRKVVPVVETDRILSVDIQNGRGFIQSNTPTL